MIFTTSFLRGCLNCADQITKPLGTILMAVRWMRRVSSTCPPYTISVLMKSPFALAFLRWFWFVLLYLFQTCWCSDLNHPILSWILRSVLVFCLDTMELVGRIFPIRRPGLSCFIWRFWPQRTGCDTTTKVRGWKYQMWFKYSSPKLGQLRWTGWGKWLPGTVVCISPQIILMGTSRYSVVWAERYPCGAIVRTAEYLTLLFAEAQG